MDPDRLRELLMRIRPLAHVDRMRPEVRYCMRHGLIHVRTSPTRGLAPKWLLAGLTDAGRSCVEVLEVDEVWHDIRARMGSSLAKATPAQVLAMGLSIMADQMDRQAA